MSDIEIFESDDSKLLKIEEKPKRKKREISSERRAQLLHNLKVGRETSRLNRQKRAKAKQIKKKNEKLDIDETIEKEIMKHSKKKNYEEELEDLRNQIKELRSQDKNYSKKSEPEKKTEPITIKESTKYHKEPQTQIEIKKELEIKPIKKGLQSKQDIMNSWNKPKTKNLFTTRWDWD